MPFILFGSTRIDSSKICFYHVITVPLEFRKVYKFQISFGADKLSYTFDTMEQAEKCQTDFEALLK
jgi:hypothetical protein